MSDALANLAGPGQPLKAEATDSQEFEGLVRSGRARLTDAENTALALESRFDLGGCAAEGVDSENGPQRRQFLPGSQAHSPAMGQEAGEKWIAAAHLQPTSLLSRSLLVYNAAHALSLAALRRKGFRASNRYLVFQVLPHTLGLGPEVWRVLDKCHNARNRSEYEGLLDISDRLLADLITATRAVAEALLSADQTHTDR
ncbi:MAG: hypothetical protein Q7T87_20045 [Polaromonas sp.]|nr:hypothetical protein [Polaromonas sp.]